MARQNECIGFTLNQPCVVWRPKHATPLIPARIWPRDRNETINFHIGTDHILAVADLGVLEECHCFSPPASRDIYSRAFSSRLLGRHSIAPLASRLRLWAAPRPDIWL